MLFAVQSENRNASGEAEWCWKTASQYATALSASDFAKIEPIRVISSGYERVELAKFQLSDATRNFPAEVVVKTFPRANFVQRIFSEKRVGTKARRAFRVAQILREHSVGTPEIIALGERFSANGSVAESKLITAFVPELSNFRDELLRIYKDGCHAPELSSLMQTVADACRAFHNCGLIHHDLGNQNIGLKKLPDGSWRVLFLDLDRVRIFPAGTLTWAQRGADLARLWLPSELRWFFSHMYCGFSPVPVEFNKALRRAVRAFEFDNKTRIFRHPIWGVKRKWAEFRAPAKESALGGIGIWIWDEKTEQPIIIHDKRHSRSFRPLRNVLLSAKEVLFRGFSLWKNYKKISAESFRVPVNFDKTFGVPLEADNTESWKTQLHFLSELENGGAKLPILLRAYHHKGREHWNFLCEKASELSARGNAVSIAFVQDREAIRSPESWREMIFLVIEKTHDFAEFYEIGHATNRGKWGIWDFRDYTEKLLPVAIAAKQAFPQIRLTGPACIDFDLHNLPGILGDVPAGTFSALSQHLYVDRRGAPENFQGKFDLVEKCAVHRAFAKTYGFSDEKIIVSETNWPLLGAGTWSPCSAFFCDKTGSTNAPHVSEDDAAKFGVRYWLLAIASGHVSRVYWWRLVHCGFGLVDDSDAENPRPRAAFFAFQKMLSALAETRFERRIFDVPAGTFCLEFSRADGSHFRVSWTKEIFPQLADFR